jgi:hypothetical protein
MHDADLGWSAIETPSTRSVFHFPTTPSAF